MDKLEKIVIIGPVYPYKGGISHYTGLMCKAFKQKYDVTMVSFKRQYPRILMKKEQKDYSNDAFKINDTQFWLDTINPINWSVTASKIKKINPDLIIIQWWHPYFAPCYCALLKKLKKWKVLFICHNVFPHERFILDKFLTERTLKKADFFIVQSSQDENDLKSVKNNCKYILTALPTFNVFKMQCMTKSDARNILKLDLTEKIILFFGFIRDYKGLHDLIDAMKIIIEKSEKIKLLIVGDFGNDREDYIKHIKSCNIENNINIYEGYIPDKEVEKFFVSTDAVVLPYKSATQSGIAQIAYGFDKPVIVTKVGGLPEIVENGITGYLVEPECPEQLAQAILEFFENRTVIDFTQNIQKVSYKYAWERMVENVERLYNQ